MIEQSVHGVIFAPTSRTAPKQTKQMKMWVAVLFFPLVSFGFVIHRQYNSVKKLEEELVNSAQQVQQAQAQYASTFQEKVTLEATLSRVYAELDATTGGILSKSAFHQSDFFAVKYVVGNPQKVAQSFKPRSTSPVSLVGVQVFGSYATGKKLILKFYEFDGTSVEGGNELGRATVNITEGIKNISLRFLFQTGIEVDPKKQYIFTIEADAVGTDVDIEYTKDNSDNTGDMYEFTPVIGSNNQVLNLNHTWKPRVEHDLKYEALVSL